MMPTDLLAISKQTFVFLLPEVLLVLVATAMMTAGAVARLPRSAWAGLTALGFVISLGTLFLQSPGGPDIYASVVAADTFSAYCRLGILLTGLIVLALAHDQVADDRAAEFFGALLMLHAGAMLVCSANELVFLFVGLELVSLPTYLLLYLPRRNAITQEAATKYFFLSIFASGLLLFGMAYLYGLTGMANIKGLAYLIHWQKGGLNLPQPQFALIALVFIMAGLGFRVAAVPFHFYAPDVYQGSPTVIAALLSWLPKVVGFTAMIRVLTTVFSYAPDAGEVSNLAMTSDKAVQIGWILAAVTMTLGNTVALAQRDLKRLFAYSSIAHAGYLLIGITAAFRNIPGGPEAVLGADGVLFYLATYALMTLGAFGVIIALSSREKPVETIHDLAGLMKTHPAAALALTLCLFSLAGIPPLAGFWGKFRIFQSAWEVARGRDFNLFTLLLVIGALNAAIGAFYYLRIIVEMIFREPREALQPRASLATQFAVGACASLSLIVGILPAPIANASRASAQAAISLPEPGEVGVIGPAATASVPPAATPVAAAR